MTGRWLALPAPCRSTSADFSHHSPDDGSRIRSTACAGQWVILRKEPLRVPSLAAMTERSGSGAQPMTNYN